MTATDRLERVREPQIAVDKGTAPKRPFRPYVVRVAITDALAIALSISVAYILRFDVNESARVGGELTPSYILVSIVLFVAWTSALFLGRTRDHRIVGAGPAEYQRVWQASWRLGAVVAILAYMLRMEIGRGFLGIAFPLGLALVLLGRYRWRQWLHRQRAVGRLQSRVLVVGHLRKAALLIGELRGAPNTGFGVIGACVPSSETSGTENQGIEVLGTVEDAARIAVARDVDIVAVVGSDDMTTEAQRRLGWDLEGTGIDIALTMSIRDVAGPRVTMQPVNGLPLVYVDEPRFAGPRYALKTVIDWVLAFAILVALAPVLLVLAALVKATSDGPVFYRQERVGIAGKTFKMIKFRSMVVDAHARLDETLAAEGMSSIGLFYKPKNDARVTRLGRMLRRYSLDELPQLFNVLRGEMSLVGPRPQIDQEVAQYDRNAHRRLLVKPGLTGLWQVSGRSELSPDEGIRMDVSYAENWTIFGDLLILARTAKAIVSGEGAY